MRSIPRWMSVGAVTLSTAASVAGAQAMWEVHPVTKIEVSQCESWVDPNELSP